MPNNTIRERHTLQCWRAALLLGVGMALWVAPARALDKCTAHIRASDGTIRVNAEDVSGTVLWGMSAATVTNAFANAGTCVTGTTAKNCTLGAGTVVTTPPLCTLYLTDDAGACSAFIKKCVPNTLPHFIDNGDGTVTDTKTGLMWERKTTDGSVHDVNKTFTWSTGGPYDEFDGTAKTAFLDVLNDVTDGGAHCFAGYCDWRLPDEEGRNTVGGPEELETILDLTQGNCGGGTGPCVVPGLGPTEASVYWSGTYYHAYYTWVVDFSNGHVIAYYHTPSYYVRAVRSGL